MLFEVLDVLVFPIILRFIANFRLSLISYDFLINIETLMVWVLPTIAGTVYIITEAEESNIVSQQQPKFAYFRTIKFSVQGGQTRTKILFKMQKYFYLQGRRYWQLPVQHD